MKNWFNCGLFEINIFFALFDLEERYVDEVDFRAESCCVRYIGVIGLGGLFQECGIVCSDLTADLKIMR